MRIVKEHNERLNEILDTAQKLFVQKGYMKCTVNDILTAIGIAKGTFYHYFKSKEEVLDAIIGRTADLVYQRAQSIAEQSNLSPEEKLLQVFLAMRVTDAISVELIDQMHCSENSLMHQKTLTAMVDAIVPVLVAVTEEGNEKGIFHCPYPKEYMQIFLVSSLNLLDDGIFTFEPEEQQMVFRALISVLGKMLGIDDAPIWEQVLRTWNESNM
ncbi:TetR/AcrR family transcriptional regulator [Anaerosporobacter faecicola]|uniref:TetR/AcrR family transcriptional regulator n=1 Tax=Anaerosporobacter faecicola TaxID=2718714 RepID=UPI00143C82A4|nr:TetR/AcrR family transcriptional regulator [Anaerosporobacter faecicola]